MLHPFGKKGKGEGERGGGGGREEGPSQPLGLAKELLSWRRQQLGTVPVDRRDWTMKSARSACADWPVLEEWKEWR